MKKQLKPFQYNISIFINKPKLIEREYYFDSVDEAWAWLKSMKLPMDTSGYYSLENTGYLGFDLTEKQFSAFTRSEK